jgi:hypothetical protein
VTAMKYKIFFCRDECLCCLRIWYRDEKEWKKLGFYVELQEWRHDIGEKNTEKIKKWRLLYLYTYFVRHTCALHILQMYSITFKILSSINKKKINSTMMLQPEYTFLFLTIIRIILGATSNSYNDCLQVAARFATTVRCTQSKLAVKIFISNIIHHSIENFKAVKNMCALRFHKIFFRSKNWKN